MAKKSSKSNMKALWDLITLVLAGVLLGFIALPHMSVLLLGETIASYSGYDLITFGENANVGVAIVLLLLVIFAALLALFAILKLLADLGVVKSSGYAKFVKIGLVISALAVVVLVIINCITLGVYCDGEADGVTGRVSGRVATWATIIVNAVLGLGAGVTTFLSAKK